MSQGPTTKEVMRLAQLVNARGCEAVELARAGSEPCSQCDATGVRVELLAIDDYVTCPVCGYPGDSGKLAQPRH